MARQLIAFLGLQARPTRYDFGEYGIYEGRVFPEALMDFLDRQQGGFDRALFLVTEAARQKIWPLLAQKQDPRLQPVPIAEGRTDLEMWTWLEALLPHIADEDRLIFDITHGLRSAPFLVFLFTAYLQQVRHAQIEGIYYGAYDLTRGGLAPVIDLSPFARLLDWLTATAFFEHTGDARHLARVLREVGQRRKIGYLSAAADELESLSLALMLTRPMEVMVQAARWANMLQRIQEDETPALRPFHEMAARLQQEYAARALTDFEGRPAAALRQQYELITWYLDNNQVLQAATLAVEWLISLVGWLASGRLLLRKGSREELARAIHQVVRLYHGRLSEDALSEKAQWLWHEHPQVVKALSQVWDKLTNVRNDLNHAGMRHGASKAQRLVQAMREIGQKLEPLAAFLGTDEVPS